MNEKLKKTIAIIGLVAIVTFSVTFVVFLIKPSVLGGRIGWIAAISFVVGLSMFLWIYLLREFPAQKQKAAEMEELREKCEEKLNAEGENAENSEASPLNENGDEPDISQNEDNNPVDSETNSETNQ